MELKKVLERRTDPRPGPFPPERLRRLARPRESLTTRRGGGDCRPFGAIEDEEGVNAPSLGNVLPCVTRKGRDLCYHRYHAVLYGRCGLGIPEWGVRSTF